MRKNIFCILTVDCHYWYTHSAPLSQIPFWVDTTQFTCNTLKTSNTPGVGCIGSEFGRHTTILTVFFVCTDINRDVFIQPIKELFGRGTDSCKVDLCFPILGKLESLLILLFKCSCTLLMQWMLCCGSFYPNNINKSCIFFFLLSIMKGRQ